MTPKEKAIDLVEKFKDDNYHFESDILDNAKSCAIIAVDGLIEAFENLSIAESGTVNIDFGHGYWMEVKNEIEKL